MADITAISPRKLRKIQAFVSMTRASAAVSECVLCRAKDPQVYRPWLIRKDDATVPPTKRGTVAVYAICDACDKLDVFDTVRRVSAELARKWWWEYERELSRPGGRT